MNIFFLDLSRQFSLRLISVSQLKNELREFFRLIKSGSANCLRKLELPQLKRVFFMSGMPFIVACLVMLAFVTSSPIRSEKFLFFSTMYAFWLGIFGSCQSLNGEVASGEWSYWVLGNRINVRLHATVVALISMISTLYQVCIFTCTLLLLDSAFGLNALVEVVGGSSDFNLVHWDTQNPSGIFTSFENWVLCISVFLVSLFAASISGVCVGMLLSACFKDTMAGVRLAVAIIVIQTIISATVLERETRFPLLGMLWRSDVASKWAYIADTKKNGATLPVLGIHKGDALLEDISFFTPQRYFYNLARVLDRNVCGVETVMFSESFSLNAAFKENGTLWNQIQKWTAKDSDLRLHRSDSQNLPVILFIAKYLMLPDLLAICTICLSCLFVVYIKIENEDFYHVLR